MEDQQAARSAWPEPPTYYKRYTDENLGLLKQAKKTGNFPENPIIAPLVPEFQLEALEPPLPPTDEYTIFDQKWQVNKNMAQFSRIKVMTSFVDRRPSTHVGGNGC